MRPVYWKSIGAWQWQMVTANIYSSERADLQPLLNYRVATLFLEMNRCNVSTWGRISKLCLLLNSFKEFELVFICK